MARSTGSSGCSRGAIVSSRYSAIAFDSNSDTLPSMLSTGTFLCGEMARNQSGRLTRSMWRNSNSMFFSRSTIAARCTHGQVSKLARRYFAMSSSPFSMPRLRGHLVLGLEVQLDLDVVRIAQEDLPARRVRHLVDAMGDALGREVLAGRLESARAECDVVDHAGIRPLLLVGAGDIVDVQHRMVAAVHPCARKIERRPWAVPHAEHVLVELHGLFELAGRYVVMVELADAHIHRASPGAVSL